METCGRCGNTIIDESSWKEAYLTQLGETNRLQRELTGFKKLFSERLYKHSALHNTYCVSLTDIILCNLQDKLPKNS